MIIQSILFQLSLYLSTLSVIILTKNLNIQLPLS